MPFGGERTVQNAHRMLEMARTLDGIIKERGPELTEEPSRENRADREFVKTGRTIAAWLHDYGHKRMNPPRAEVMPYFAAGGEWLRLAEAAVGA